MAPKTSSAAIPAFLADLPVERRREVERVRKTIRRNLPDGYEEVVSRNMLVYQVPLDTCPDTYNGHRLWYVALASEKSYLSLHVMPVYGDGALAKQLEDGFRRAGKRLDMGKACIRFRTADDLALDVIGQIVAKIPRGPLGADRSGFAPASAHHLIAATQKLVCASAFPWSESARNSRMAVMRVP